MIFKPKDESCWNLNLGDTVIANYFMPKDIWSKNYVVTVPWNEGEDAQHANLKNEMFSVLIGVITEKSDDEIGIKYVTLYKSCDVYTVGFQRIKLNDNKKWFKYDLKTLNINFDNVLNDLLNCVMVAKEKLEDLNMLYNTLNKISKIPFIELQEKIRS